MSETPNSPQNFEQPSISEGIQHGPYAEGLDHPIDQSNPYHTAAKEAYDAGRIGEEQAIAAQDILEPWDQEADDAFQAKENAHTEALDEDAMREYYKIEDAHEAALRENDDREEQTREDAEHDRQMAEREAQDAKERADYLEGVDRDDDTDPDREAGGGTTSQERYAAAIEHDNEDNEQREYETTEDPLAGDIDKFVHPDETRTDEQIERDEKYPVKPY